MGMASSSTFPRSITEMDVWDAVVHMASDGNSKTSAFRDRITVFGDFLYCEHSKVMWRKYNKSRLFVFIHVPSRKHNAILRKIVEYARTYGIQNAHEPVTMPWILDAGGKVVRGGYEGFMEQSLLLT
jgi:hypothetical protein